MLDALLLDEAMLDAGAPTPHALVVADYEDLEFDGFGLQNTAIISQLILRDSPPSRDVTSYRTPRRDGGGILGSDFAGRSIRVRGILSESTAAALDDAVDEFKRRLAPSEKVLSIKVNGAIRQCVATLVNTQGIFDRRESYHVSTTPFDLEFLSTDPNWRDPEYTSEDHLSQTSLNVIAGMNNVGSWKADLVLVILIEAATAITALNVTNGENDEAITITRSFAAGDVIIIDGETKSLTVNGVEVEYSGIFPRAEPGDNPVEVTWTGTSLTWNLTVKHKPTYL